MDWWIYITVDYNDADYETLQSKISDEDLQRIKPVIEAIKKFKPYESDIGMFSKHMRTHDQNWPFGECLRTDMGEKTPKEIYPDLDPDAIDLFQSHCPECYEYGFHDIEIVRISPYAETETLFKRESKY